MNSNDDRIVELLADMLHEQRETNKRLATLEGEQRETNRRLTALERGQKIMNIKQDATIEALFTSLSFCTAIMYNPHHIWLWWRTTTRRT
jgi:hypothetical protein